MREAYERQTYERERKEGKGSVRSRSYFDLGSLKVILEIKSVANFLFLRLGLNMLYADF